LYVEYLQDRFGRQSIGNLLSAYREGLSTEAAIANVCRMTKEDFEKGYRQYLNDILKTLRSKPAETVRTFVQLQEAHEKDPNDPNTSAQLAEQYLLRRRQAEARKLADAVLARKKGHPLASYVKARLLLAAGDDEGARTVLEAAVNRENPEPKVIQSLGRLYYEVKEFPRAADVFELGRRTEPYERKWLTELARVHGQAGAKDKHIAVLMDLVPMDADDLGARKQLARMLLDAGRFAEAERYARQALEIDVLDLEAQRALGDALLGQKKVEPAIETYTLILEIDDREDEARLKLAMAYLEGGSKAKAQVEVEKVLARNPAHLEAKRLKTKLGM
jgi:tetratricopeptide (TPR) repeat protein